jgi:hypothetical protein
LLVNGGFTMVYQAMFDEMDEGTQIFKVTATPPRGSFFETYAPMPSDYYLRLVQRTANYLANSQQMPEVIEDVTGREELAGYLRRNDATIYAAARESYALRRSFLQLADALTAHAPAWATLMPGEVSVTARGQWQAHYRFSEDPTAALMWRALVATNGTYRLRIRCADDAHGNRTAAATLTIAQAGKVIAVATIDLRDRGPSWSDAATLELTTNAPCEIVFENQTGDGVLIPVQFELVQAPPTTAGVK